MTIPLYRARELQKDAARYHEFARDTLALFLETGMSGHWWQYVFERDIARQRYRAARILMGIESYKWSKA